MEILFVIVGMAVICEFYTRYYVKIVKEEALKVIEEELSVHDTKIYDDAISIFNELMEAGVLVVKKDKIVGYRNKSISIDKLEDKMNAKSNT